MWKRIFFVTLVAGTLDILAAFIQAYLVTGTKPDIVLKYIASGAIGREAFAGGYAVMTMGLLFHFLIVFACVAIFFMLYPKLKFLHHKILLNSFFIAIIAWVVTSQLIIPNSKISPSAFHIKEAVRALAILFICVGMPIAIAAKKYYQQKITP